MGKKDTESVKHLEYYQNLQIPYGMPFIVRIDGNRFTKYTKKYTKPFDIDFHKKMVNTAKFVMKEVPFIYESHIFSDEISFYFNSDTEWFDRRVEKIVSILSAMASSYFSKESGDVVWFDARIILTPTEDLVKEYRKDRCLDAFRNCVNGYAYYKLIESGLSNTKATKRLLNKTSSDKQELLFSQFNINVNMLHLWQKQGTFLQWVTYEKVGYNPITQKNVKTIRKRLWENL